MIRRQFIKLATLASATGLASLSTTGANAAEDTRKTTTVTWRIQGFTCVTCAVGLETMLRQQKGVKSAEASYSDARVTIQFHPKEVSEAALRKFITDIGFTAEEQKG